MPYYHCRKCMHEFEYIAEAIKPKCDWCDADRPILLEKQTPLEKMCIPENLKKLVKELCAIEGK